jgi:plastocyanin
MLGTALPGVDLRGTAKTGAARTVDAVVWLDAPGAPPRSPQSKVVLDQRNQRFYPHVLAVQTGTVVDFPNHDRVFHNVFSFRDAKRFDLGLYPVGAVKRIPFNKPGLSRIFCNIHPHMAAYIMVVDTPYFGVSDEQGIFAIRDLPPGTYTYHAWRPGGEILSGSTTARNGGTLDVRWP